jgi:tetratricopeptide (TPR) repeat protein
MPFVDDADSQPTSFIEAKDLFIGRINEMHFFIKGILKPEHPAFNILSIYGQAGVGKTTLLNHFIAEAHTADFKDYCLTAIVDEYSTNPASIMENFAAQLHITGEFKQALDRYKTSLRKLQAKQEILRETFGRKVTSEIASSVVEKIPVVGGILGYGAELAVEQIWDELHYRQLSKEADRLEDPINDLTTAFVLELNALAKSLAILTKDRSKRKKRILLLIDTFEQLAPSIAPWLLDYFLKANISRNVVLLVAGRSPIERSTPDDPKQWLPYANRQNIYHISLECLTEEETCLYLIERGITERAKIKTIWRLSYGLPLYLGLWTSNPEGTIDPTADVVENFLRWIPQQEQAKRKLVLESALLSRSFNQDELEAFSYLSEFERPLLYQWLIMQPFIRNDPQSGKHTYHELAQELFSRHLYQVSPKEYVAARLELASYYKQLLGNVEISENNLKLRSAQWRELTLALAEQLFFQPDEINHVRAIEHILNAYRYANKAEKIEIHNFLRKLHEGTVSDQVNILCRQIVGNLIQYLTVDISKKDLIKAAAFLIEKTSCDPLFSPMILANIYRTRGNGYTELKEYSKAIDEYSRAIALNRTDDLNFKKRSYVYQLMKRYEDALADLNQALTLDPQSVNLYNTRSLTYRLMKRYEDALADLNQALTLDPKGVSLYNTRSLTYRLMKRYEDALADLDHALTLDPQSVNLYNNRSRVYQEMKRYEDALADLNHALTLDPKGVSLYNTRSLTYCLMKRYEDALADLNQALTLDPSSAWTLANRGITYRLMKCYEDALADLNQALTLDPSSAWTLANRGITYRLMKCYEDALADLNQALTLDPSSAWTLANRGAIYRYLGDHDKAIEDLENAVQIGSDEISWNNYGLELSYVGRYAEAMQSYQKGLDKEPDNHYSLYNIAVVMARWKGLADAQAYIDTARATLIDLQSSDEFRGSVLYGFGGIKALEGEGDQALKYLQQAMQLEEDAIKWARDDIAWLDLRSDAHFQALIRRPS